MAVPEWLLVALAQSPPAIPFPPFFARSHRECLRQHRHEKRLRTTERSYRGVSCLAPRLAGATLLLMPCSAMPDGLDANYQKRTTIRISKVELIDYQHHPIPAFTRALKDPCSASVGKRLDGERLLCQKHLICGTLWLRTTCKHASHPGLCANDRFVQHSLRSSDAVCPRP